MLDRAGSSDFLVAEICHFCYKKQSLEGHDQVNILYINSISLSVCPGRYILNPCEQGVVFVFNVPSWTCLSV